LAIGVSTRERGVFEVRVRGGDQIDTAIAEGVVEDIQLGAGGQSL
jgi:hypothetical protein